MLSSDTAVGAQQGRVTGVIIPPPEIRAVVDKTASYAVKFGKSFEEKIRNSEEGKSAKFNFMRPFDPYHAYYEFKIREIEEGTQSTGTVPVAPAAAPRAPIEPNLKQAGATTVATTVARASVVSPIAKFAAIKTNVKPPDLEFVSGHPSSVAAVDLEVIKLTAQYTATNGREFLAGLALKEQRNPQYDFLKPTHMLFGYFTTLVDAYARILNPASKNLVSLKEKSLKKMLTLEQVVQRWSWSRAEKARQQRESAEADAEREAFQAIDWFDFVVVETIVFPEDEQFALPDYLSGATRTQGSFQQLRVEPRTAKSLDDSNDMDMDMDVDMDVDNVSVPVASTSIRPALGHGDDEDVASMHIISDYVPRVATQQNKPLTMVDPISGKLLGVNEVGQHMKVQLLDPRGRVEQQRFQDRQKDTGFAEGVSIADNLRNFAQKRGDIFSTNAETSAAPSHETKTVQWDGHQSTVAAFQAMQQSLAGQLPPPQAPVQTTMPLTGPVSAAPLSASMPAPRSAPTSVVTLPPVSFSAGSAMPVPLAATYPAPIQVSMPPPPAIVIPPIAAPFPFPMPPIVPLAYTEESAPKRPKLDADLVDEKIFASQYPGPVVLNIQLPPDVSSNQTGGLLSIMLPSLLAMVKDIKDEIAAQLKSQGNESIPANKMQLKESTSGFLKDGNTLAYHNVQPGSTLELSLRSRGGKR